jgi:hypothetical protein
MRVIALRSQEIAKGAQEKVKSTAMHLGGVDQEISMLQ